MLQIKTLRAQRKILQREVNKALRNFPNCLIENGYPADAKYSIQDVRINHSMSGGDDLAYILYEIDDDTPHDEGAVVDGSD